MSLCKEHAPEGGCRVDELGRTGRRPGVRGRAARHRPAPQRAAPTRARAVGGFRPRSLSLLPNAIAAFVRAALARGDGPRQRPEALRGEDETARALSAVCFGPPLPFRVGSSIMKARPASWDDLRF